MKLFSPIIVIALLNLFSSVFSLPMPMDNSGSTAPASADTTLAPAHTYNIGDIVNVVFLRKKNDVSSAGIFMGISDNMLLFLPLCTVSDTTWCILIKELDSEIPSMSKVFRSLSPKGNSEYATIGNDFRAVVPNYLGMKIQKATGIQRSVPGIVHDDVSGVTRLDADTLESLLSFVKDKDIKPRDADVNRINNQRNMSNSQTSQHTGAGTSQSAPATSQIRGTSRRQRERKGDPYPLPNRSTGGGRASSFRSSTNTKSRTSTGARSSLLPPGRGDFPPTSGSGSGSNSAVHRPQRPDQAPYSPSGYPPPRYSGQALAGGVVPPPAPGSSGPSHAQGLEHVVMGDEHIGMSDKDVQVMTDEQIEYIRFLAEHGGFF